MTNSLDDTIGETAYLRDHNFSREKLWSDRLVAGYSDIPFENLSHFCQDYPVHESIVNSAMEFIRRWEAIGQLPELEVKRIGQGHIVLRSFILTGNHRWSLIELSWTVINDRHYPNKFRFDASFNCGDDPEKFFIRIDATERHNQWVLKNFDKVIRKCLAVYTAHIPNGAISVANSNNPGIEHGISRITE